jgi:hypothetical protein
LVASILVVFASTAGGQLVWQEAVTAVGTGNATVAKPSGTASGNLLVAGLMLEKGSSETVTPPAGWTLIRRTNNGTNAGMATYYRLAGGSEPANYTFNIALGSKWSIGISRVTGANPNNPIDVSGGLTGASSTSVTAPSVTTSVANTLVLAFYTNKKNATYTAAGTTTERYDVPNDPGGLPSNMLATFVRATAGATGNRTATASLPEFWAGQQVAVWPDDGTILTPGFAGATGTNSWSNPGNAVGSGQGSCSTVNGSAGNPSGFWNTFGLSIPAGNTITGVRVEIKASRGTAAPANPTINIGKNESTLGTAKNITGLANQACGTGQNILSFGGPTDLWGFASITPAEVNSANFAVRLRAGTNGSSQLRLNWIRVTIFHTAAGAATPGAFNVFETSTIAGAITGVITTKIAGSGFGLDVAAISGGVQQAGFTDAVIVELLGNNNLGVSLDAQNCPTSFTLLQTVAPNPMITAGRSTVNFAAVANSWRDVRVRVRWPTAAPTVTSCSTDNFALRPSTFASLGATDNDWQTAGTVRTLGNTSTPSGGVIHKAGRPFTVQATAVNGAATPATTTNYTGTPTATLSDCGGSSACPSTLGVVTLGASFVAGILTANTATYDEVGSFSMQLQDSAFASVDAGDGTPADCSASGRYVCSSTLDVGRFVPDHFAVALNTPSFGTACGAFTYVGQKFNYATAPVITLTARNFAGGTTANYAGGLWQITNAGLTGKSYTSAAGTLDVSGLPGTDPAIFPAGAGTGTLTFGSGTGLSFTRTTPVAPFDADISLAINVIDADGVASAINPARFGTATPGNGIAFSSGKSMRFGRLTIRNANGSQLLPLRVPVEAQYWSGAPINGFVTNTLDSCTAITSANDAMGNYSGNLSGSPTCETAVISGGGLNAGRGVLALAAPGSGNGGSVDLTVNLGATASGTTCTTLGGVPVSATTPNLPHLQGNWSGGAYNVNPSARATFGISGSSEEVVFVRENF